MTNLGDNYLLYENALYSKFINGTSVEGPQRRLVIDTKNTNEEQKQYKNVFLDNLGVKLNIFGVLSLQLSNY